MRILLLQEERYLPTFGGSHKSNRLLLEALALRGHQCLAVCTAYNNRTSLPEFLRQMGARGVNVRTVAEGLFSYSYRGVEVSGLKLASLAERGRRIAERIEAFSPDWVLVSDDPRRYLLRSALASAPGRVVALVHNHLHLPCGPLATERDEAQARLMREARGIAAVSRYGKDYLERHADVEAVHITFPIYGEGPFPSLARFDAGFVTMINPCVIKGLGIFLKLASEFPEFDFAAVPTWGADEAVMCALRERPNVKLIEPADEVERILRQTRVLLVPSLIPETFGCVVPEAMLRGIPVLASDMGGLREAKLGVEYLLPVSPALRDGAGYSCPEQDVAPWAEALGGLLSDSETYSRCSASSREAALKFVSQVAVAAFEDFLVELGRAPV